MHVETGLSPALALTARVQPKMRNFAILKRICGSITIFLHMFSLRDSRLSGLYDLKVKEMMKILCEATHQQVVLLPALNKEQRCTYLVAKLVAKE